jgi:hypothetical protein
VLGKDLQGTFIRDYGLVAGFDLNTKDDQFASRVRKTVIGPSIAFGVPGFWNAALVYRTTRNHNGIVGVSVNFDPTWGISTAWGIPIPAIGAVFKGFADYIDEKCKNGFGAATKPEILAEAAIMFDVGRFAGKKDTAYIGAGYQYWKNEFGNNASADSTGGANARVPQLLFEVHF